MKKIALITGAISVHYITKQGETITEHEKILSNKVYDAIDEELLKGLNTTLRQYIEAEILPRYQAFDAAHQLALS